MILVACLLAAAALVCAWMCGASSMDDYNSFERQFRPHPITIVFAAASILFLVAAFYVFRAWVIG